MRYTSLPSADYLAIIEVQPYAKSSTTLRVSLGCAQARWRCYNALSYDRKRALDGRELNFGGRAVGDRLTTRVKRPSTVPHQFLLATISKQRLSLRRYQ